MRKKYVVYQITSEFIERKLFSLLKYCNEFHEEKDALEYIEEEIKKYSYINFTIIIRYGKGNN